MELLISGSGYFVGKGRKGKQDKVGEERSRYSLQYSEIFSPDLLF